MADEWRRVTAEDIPADGVDAMIAAHTHAFVTKDARAKARIAAFEARVSERLRHVLALVRQRTEAAR